MHLEPQNRDWALVCCKHNFERTIFLTVCRGQHSVCGREASSINSLDIGENHRAFRDEIIFVHIILSRLVAKS